MEKSLSEVARERAIRWVKNADLFDLITTLPPSVFGEKPKIKPTASGPDVKKIRKLMEEPAMKRSNMSPAARKAVSVRMKKYWADRRKQKAKKK